jgi:valyl-tRNA synthetase
LTSFSTLSERDGLSLRSITSRVTSSVCLITSYFPVDAYTPPPPLVFIHAQGDAEAELFASQIPTIVSLTKGCKAASVARALSDVPTGCGSAVLSHTVAVHILVRGLVDLDAEIAKCDKKLDVARLSAEKQRKIAAVPDYESTVPEAVRMANADKLKTLDAEIANLELSKESFAKLK